MAVVILDLLLLLSSIFRIIEKNILQENRENNGFIH